MKETKLNSISIMKGLAIILVTMVHTTQYMPENLNAIIFQITRIGRWGCQVFFVVSGFTLSASWNRTCIGCKKFILKRYLSIAPSYYVAILFFQLYSLLFKLCDISPFMKINTTLFGVISNIFLLQGLNPSAYNNVVPGGWYLGTQWIFYLLFPLLIELFECVLNKNHDIRLIPTAALLLSFLVQVIIAIIHGDASLSKLSSFIHFSALNQLPCFLCGICLFYLWNSNKVKKTSSIRILLKFLLWGTISSFAFYFLRKVPLIYVFVPMGYSLAACYFFLYLESRPEPKQYFVKKLQAVLIRCGEISFAGYYMNVIVVMLIPSLFTKFLDKYDGTRVFLALLPFMLLGTYFASVGYNKIIIKVNAYAKSLCNRVFKMDEQKQEQSIRR